MNRKEDTTALLPDGTRFPFWEKENVFNREIHVDGTRGTKGEGDGSTASPFLTIQEAAEAAEPGTRILIHGGTYREWVRPGRGGESPEKMISYEAFGDGEVIIKASEQVWNFCESTGWRRGGFPGEPANAGMRIWQHRLDADMFRGYNPFCAVNILHDRLFLEYDKTDMTTYLNRRGMVFCDGKPLKQVSLYGHMSREEGTYWVEANGQTVHFRLPGDGDPAEHVMEITCREQCFAPEAPFLSYIKVKGLTFAHAATGAPVPQRGALSCHRGHHWIIEDCVIDWSNAVGIDVGNECWHHEWREGQIIGSSVIRRCTVRDAGVCGIAGLHAENMLVEDCLITGTGWQRMELSWEAGGMKLHNSRNGLFRRNIFRDTFRADHIWLDCGNENNRLTRNLFLNGIEQREAVFIECTKDGVNLIDHNIFWNVEGRFDKNAVVEQPGSSGWYKMMEEGVVNGYAVYGEGTDRMRVVNNLIGKCRSAGYFAKPVAFRMHGLERGGTSRDAVLAGNIFYDCGEAAIKFPTRDNASEGNLYVKLKGGYLRVLYPEPEVCLNLPAWQEFEGFDLTGQEGWFDIQVDTENYTLTFTEAGEALFGMPGQAEQRKHIKHAEDMVSLEVQALEQETKIDRRVLWEEDFLGNAGKDGRVLPGPFRKLQENEVYYIDPRKAE